jgi:hypothetical protein
MSMPAPDGGNRPRASRSVKLVLMGVAGAALLYSCTPVIGSAIGGFPGFWFFGNPFYRGPRRRSELRPRHGSRSAMRDRNQFVVEQPRRWR